ncbi:MAG TPA: sugar phosphate isomerase [Lactobacillus sp.]|nr:sugar phosphate isomerase [Lactobacillus sp.]
MNKNNIVLNTLVFDEEHNEGVKQTEMLSQVAGFGIKNAEVRREYFTDPMAAAPAIGKTVKKLGLKLFYSVPKTIFTDDGELNPDLPLYFEEASKMGVSSLKMNIGHFDKFTGDLHTALARYSDSDIEFNVENDQGQLNGSTQNILKFLNASKNENIDIKFVFDLGNWRFVGEKENDAAKSLKPFVRYIHVKNDIVDEQSKCQVVALDQGIINWKATLKLLPNNLPVALEYPATDDEIKAGINLLVNFA